MVARGCGEILLKKRELQCGREVREAAPGIERGGGKARNDKKKELRKWTSRTVIFREDGPSTFPTEL